MTDEENAVRLSARPWPRIHLVYFLLAAFDLVAILGGLFLSYQVIKVFDSNVRDHAALDRLMASSWILVDTAADAQSEITSALATRDGGLAELNFKSKMYEFRQELDHLHSQAALILPERAAKRAESFLAQLGSATADMESTATDVLAKTKDNDPAGAVRAAAALQTRYERMRHTLGDINQLIAMVKVSTSDQSSATVASLEKYEYVIGGMIAIIVCCVAVYGLWVGRLMREKYEELEQANAELAIAQADSTAFAERLQAINDDVTALNRELADNMRKLGETQDEMVRRGKLLQLGQLVATVANELRNPMGAVRTSASILVRKLKDKDLGVEPQLERIDNGVVRCERIIAELLDFSPSGALVLETRAVDDWLAGIVEEQARTLPPTVAVECKLGLGDLEARFDPERIERMMRNLLLNAAEALTGKAPQESAAIRNFPRIVISTKHSSRGIEIVVADNGPGISEENLTRIREPLFSTKDFGTGLGLAVAERILELHGGGLEIDSTPGKGACFTAWLPTNPLAQEAAA